MKNKAMTVLEILIVISIMAVISAIGMNVLRVYMGRDTDITKFKHAFATLSEVVYSLKNDASIYPEDATGFSDMSKYVNYADSESFSAKGKEYEGSEKFKKLFTSKFNVLERNVNVDLGTSVPLIRYTDTAGDEHFKNSTTINCFIENKGFMFCPPETDTNGGSLNYIYVPMYVSQIDVNDKNTMGIKKAVFVEISNTGKIEIPAFVYYDKPDGVNVKYNVSKKAYCEGDDDDSPVVRDKILIDCTNKDYQDCMDANGKNREKCTGITDYNSYSHCKVLDKIMDVNF